MRWYREQPSDGSRRAHPRSRHASSRRGDTHEHDRRRRDREHGSGTDPPHSGLRGLRTGSTDRPLSFRRIGEAVPRGRGLGIPRPRLGQRRRASGITHGPRKVPPRISTWAVSSITSDGPTSVGSPKNALPEKEPPVMTEWLAPSRRTAAARCMRPASSSTLQQEPRIVFDHRNRRSLRRARWRQEKSSLRSS